MTDFQILGIEETQDPAAIKSAFRRRIKEVHPDHCPEEDAFKNHLLFIQINQAYTRLMSRFDIKNAAPASPVNRSAHANAPSAHAGTAHAGTAHGAAMPGQTNVGTALVQSKDPAYAFYKTGMKFFMAIHPSKWNDESQLQVPIKGDTSKEQEELKLRVKGLIKLFPKAYYYLSVVVHEYPESIWAADAREKMTLIEDRTRMYKKIIESFGLFAPDHGPKRPMIKPDDMVF